MSKDREGFHPWHHNSWIAGVCTDLLDRALILLDLVRYSCQEAVIKLGAVLLDEFQKFQC